MVVDQNSGFVMLQNVKAGASLTEGRGAKSARGRYVRDASRVSAQVCPGGVCACVRVCVG